MSFGLYVVGYLIVIGGMVYGAVLIHLPSPPFTAGVEGWLRIAATVPPPALAACRTWVVPPVPDCGSIQSTLPPSTTSCCGMEAA